MTKVGVKRSYVSSGAVVANGLECARVGRKILEQGGSAVDSAIATLFCEGVTCPQSMGLGGGFLALIYNRKTKSMEFLNAREVAPEASTQQMFTDGLNSSKIGGMSVAVPGELKGYWELHQKYGKLPWKALVEPAIELCEEGHIITPYLARVLTTHADTIKTEPTLKEIYVDSETNEVCKEGDIIRRPQLAEALRIIAKEGVDAIYSKTGSLLSPLVEDIKAFGGIVTEEDFVNYSVRWDRDISKTQLKDGYSLYSSPLPGSGPLIHFIFNVLNELEANNNQLTWPKIIETFKFAYGQRTNLGDSLHVKDIKQTLDNLYSSEYAKHVASIINNQQKTSNCFSFYGGIYGMKEDHGTAHVSVLAPDGDAISVISTINGCFGAMIRSRSTGIILNNEMDDFSIPGQINAFGLYPSPANYIQPGKQPLSSMAPTIILDSAGNVRMCIGAAGGAKITLSIVSVILQHMYFKKSLFDSVKQPRMYHFLAPMEIKYERGIDADILEELHSFGHTLTEIPTEIGFSAVTAITNELSGLHAIFDTRRGGSAELINIDLVLQADISTTGRKRRKTDTWQNQQEISMLIC